MKESSLIQNLYKREVDSSFNTAFQQQSIFPKHLVTKLNLEAELQGHEGCVNCLEWNTGGTLLASGSDDLKIILWDPFRKKLLKKIETKHRGNIFSVKFIPSTNDGIIASAAADRNIFVYDVEKDLAINEIYSHQNRVKRLATAPDQSFMFWSCGEDGFVLQHDIRLPSNKCSSLLLDYAKNKYNTSANMEAKCIALNPVRSEQIAVGCSDPYARIYDRRMIKLMPIKNRNGVSSSSNSSSTSSKCLFEYCLKSSKNSTIPFTYYVPGHLPRKIEEYRKRMKNLSVTHLTFSPNGRELLVNLGGEQLYLFDVIFSRPSNDIYDENNRYKYDSFRDMFQDVNKSACTNPASSSLSQSNISSFSSNNDNKIVNRNNSSSDSNLKELLSNKSQENNQKKKYPKLPPKAEELKAQANSSFEQQNYVEAVEFYNQAIEIVPDSPILYGNRAAAMMKRNWEGDAYSAMLDCYKALNLDIMHLKSHFRLAKCLYDLKWYQEANDCIEIFCQRFPDYAKSTACENLVNEIKQALNKMKENEAKKKKTSTTSRSTVSDHLNSQRFYSYLTNENSDTSSEEEEESDNEEDNNEISDNEEAEDDDENIVNNDEASNDNFLELSDEENSNPKNETSTSEESDQDENKEAAVELGPLRRSTRKRKRDNNNNTNSKTNKSCVDDSTKKKTKNNKVKLQNLIQNYNQTKSSSYDFKSRYCGHCNVATDIKESAFIGDNYICAGSDDGSFFIWDKTTTNVVRVLKGDESIVNCIQPHPSTSMLATSGIDPLVRIWTPKFVDEPIDEDEGKSTSRNHDQQDNDERIVHDIKSAVLNNQLQMNSHPFEFLFLNLTQNVQNWDYDDDNSNTNSQQSVACRPS